MGLKTKFEKLPYHSLFLPLGKVEKQTNKSSDFTFSVSGSTHSGLRRVETSVAACRGHRCRLVQLSGALYILIRYCGEIIYYFLDLN